MLFDGISECQSSQKFHIFSMTEKNALYCQVDEVVV